MAWFRRSGKLRYQRTKVINGRFRTEYLGSGPEAHLAAELDASTRAARRLHDEAVRAEETDWRALMDQQDEFERLLTLLMHAHLLAAGYRLHLRGEWRRWKLPHEQSA